MAPPVCRSPFAFIPCGFPDMPIADQPRAYAALRFSQLAGSTSSRCAMRSGLAIWCCSTTVALHGRTAIDETGGVRELHGTYIPRRDLLRTRKLTVIEPLESSARLTANRSINRKPPCPASSSPAPSPAAATPSTSRRTSRSRPSRLPTRRSKRPKPVLRSCTATFATSTREPRAAL